MTISTKQPAPKRSASDKAYRRACAVAALGGLYSAYGREIMTASQEDFEKAIRSVRRVAYEQADEMLSREAS